MTQTRKWAMGTAGIVVLLLVAGWFLLISPKKADTQQSLDDTAAAVQKNESCGRTSQLLQSEQKGLPEQQAKLAAIRSHLPDNPQLPALIRSMDAMATDSDVNLLGVTNADPVFVQVAGAGTGAPGAAPVKGGLQYSAVTLDVFGTYFTLEKFISSLETSTRSILVYDISLTPAAGKDAAGPLEANIQAKVFNLSPETVTAPTTGTTGAVTTTTSTTAQ